MDHSRSTHWQQIMERWYVLDTDPVKTVPDDNASWGGGQFFMEKQTVLDGLKPAGSHMRPCSLSGGPCAPWRRS